MPFGALDFAPHPVVFCLLVFSFAYCLFFSHKSSSDATLVLGNIRLFRSLRFEQQILNSDRTDIIWYLSDLICFSITSVTCNIAGPSKRPDAIGSCKCIQTCIVPMLIQFFEPSFPWATSLAKVDTKLKSHGYLSTPFSGESPGVYCNHTTHIPWDKLQCIGEASNPGPNYELPDAIHIPDDAFQFGLINPTGLHQKADCVASLGRGVWSIAESRVTHKSRSLLRKQFKSLQFHTDFSDPVPPCSKTRSDVYRGIAAGVACISSFPIRSVNQDIPQHIKDSFRLIATHVSLGPHTTLLVITVYAPPPNNQTIEDPSALTADLVSTACDLIRDWRGPAILAGDFNQEIKDFEQIQHLLTIGWVDAQDLSVQKFCHNKKPTCITAQGQSCHSKIWCSPSVAASLLYCNAIDDHLFANHPTLVLFCDFKCFTSPKLQWHLPKPFQCAKFDGRTLDDFQPCTSDTVGTAFADFISQGDVEGAAKVWVDHTEKMLSGSARDENDLPIVFSSNHFGRAKGPKIKHHSNCVPVLRCARPGEMNSINTQAPTWFRQHLRQSRRLNTMVCLLRARDRNPTTDNIHSCDELWHAIGCAEGFRGKFPKWCVLNLGCPFHHMTPTVEYCQNLAVIFQEYFKQLDSKFKHQRQLELKKRSDVDWKSGGSLAFSALKEEGPLPPAYVARTVQAQIRRVRWDKHGKTVLPCRDADNFKVGCAVCFQGQSAIVTNTENNQLAVDRPFFLRGSDLTVKQKQFFYDPQEASGEVVSTWNAFLQRDKNNLVDQWSDAERIAEMIPQQDTIYVPDYSVELWRRTQSNTPLRSARGSCGFTVCEMRSLPDWCLEVLFDLFRVIDETSTWPAMWLYAFTIMLPKTSVPESPLDLRPITILSRIYRQWSRFKAIALLVGISSKVPNIIAGGTSTSSLMLSAHFQEVLESESNGSECNGVTIDIIKCYNVIPRYPLSLLMHKMGWPRHVIQTYISALMNLQRSFQTLGSVSSWQRSYTGVPEGCALAVAAMLTLSSSLFFCLKVTSPLAELFTFADNWALLFRRCMDTEMGVRCLNEFCCALKLSISVPKSWMWALESSTLKRIGTLTLQGCAIPTIKHTKDLGVDLTYQGVRKKTHLKHRLKLGLVRCGRVPSVSCPKNKQSHLIHMGCFPKAGFGIELDTANQKDFNSFRTVVARAVGLSRKGASPWIALSLLGKIHDFQFFALRRTVFFWRQYVNHFPNRVPHILHKLQNPSTKGPIANLLNVLNEVGLPLQGDSVVSCYFGTINWMRCSKRFMNLVLRVHWVQYVCTRLTAIHRKHFHGPFIDTDGFHRNLSKFDRTNQQMLKAHASGTNYTNNARSKYMDVDAKCPFCGLRDSREHRILECANLATERQVLSLDTLRLLQNCSTLRHFGLTVLDNQWMGIRQEFPPVGSWDEIYQSLTVDPYCANHEYHLFTDGSCFNNGDPFLAIAASAVVVYHAYLQPQSSSCTRCLLPSTDHSSYRGEVFAFYICCVQFNRGIIYSDCQTAIDEFCYVLQCVANNAQPSFRDHEDLWHEIYKVVLRKNCVFRVIKVKAHSENTPHATRDLLWKSQSNAEADLQAKNAITIDNHCLFEKIMLNYSLREKLKSCSAEVMSFQVSAAWRAIRTNSQKLISDSESIVTGKGVIPTHLSSWRNDLLEGQCMACKFCGVFLHRLALWANSLQWDLHTVHHTSFIELMLSYIFSTKSFPPFPVKKYQHKENARAKIWLLKDLNPTKDFQNTHCGDLLSGFVRITNWCAKHLGTELFPGIRKPDVCSLSRYGYRGKAVGFKARAALPEQHQVDVFCNTHLPHKKVFDAPVPFAMT